MNQLKQIVTTASFATVMIVTSLATDLPAKADSYSKKCTRGANNSVSCTTSGSSSSRSTSSSSSSTTRTNTNVDINVSEKDVENIFKGIFNDGRNDESSQTDRNSRQNQTPKIPYFKF